MTLRECIERIERIDTDGGPQEVYRHLFETVEEYDSSLAYDLTEDYCYDDWIVDVIHEMNDLSDIQSLVEGLDADYGIYYDCGYHEFENADLEQLKENILDRLNDRLDDEEDDEDEDYEEDEDDSAEVEWIEEDDDFLTKEVK